MQEKDSRVNKSLSLNFLPDLLFLTTATNLVTLHTSVRNLRFRIFSDILVCRAARKDHVFNKPKKALAIYCVQVIQPEDLYSLLLYHTT